MTKWNAEVSFNDKEFYGAGRNVWLDMRRELVQYMGKWKWVQIKRDSERVG